VLKGGKQQDISSIYASRYVPPCEDDGPYYIVQLYRKENEVPGESLSKCGGQTPGQVSFLVFFFFLAWSVLFRLYCAPLFFFFLLLLAEMQAGKAWEPSKNLSVFRKRKVFLSSGKR
jgi:hypothetical protein